jgi:hypothetical protein
MEDIIGFEDQIGAKFSRVIKRAVKTPIRAAVTKTNKPTVKPTVRPTVTPTVRPTGVRPNVKLTKPVQTPRGAAMDKAVATRIATGRPIPAKLKAAIDRRQATGKPLPPAIRRAVAIKKPVAAKTIAPAQVPFRRTMQQQRIQQNKVQRAVATQIVQRKEATNQPIPVRALTKVTATKAVTAATPIQRSYMPVDLPYQKIAPKTKRLKIPATKFSLPTDIDLVQPSVDAGTTNYYGK